MAYSKVYKSIKSGVVEASKELIPALWHTEGMEEQGMMMQTWLSAVADIYEVERPALIFSSSQEGYNQTGGGCYNCDTNKITLFVKPSFVTLAHEFRHMMQHKKGVKMYKDDSEEDARAWSVSLFRLTNEKAYKAAVRKGILHFN